MPDLLVKLYDLPDPTTRLESLRKEGVLIRRAMAYEKHLMAAWVLIRFGEGWASECEVAFARAPIACHMATSGGHILGFACHDATALTGC